MKITAIAGALLVGVAGTAQAAVYEFTTAQTPAHAVLGEGFAVTPWSPEGPVHGRRVSQSGHGLGVVRDTDFLPGWNPLSFKIDSVFGDEALLISFDQAVRLDRVSFSFFDHDVLGRDEADLWLDGVHAGVLDSRDGSSFEIGREVDSFAVGASWSFLEDGLSADGFKLRSFEATPIDVAPVPLPAAGPLLLAGLGAAAWMRRRR